MNAKTDILSIRQTSSKRGYPYYAVGIYRPMRRQRDGRITYRLIGNYTSSCRSCRLEFHGVADHPRYIGGIRHGTPV